MCNLANVTKDSLGRTAPEGPRKLTWVNGLELEPPFIVLQEIDLAIEALKLKSEEMVYFPDSSTFRHRVLLKNENWCCFKCDQYLIYDKVILDFMSK